MTAAQAEWETTSCPATSRPRLALGPDPDGEGDLFATLVRRGDSAHRPRTPCWRCTASPTTSSTPNSPTTSPPAGSAFYALDLHKCGRSWRDGQTPHFTTDLARYDRRAGARAGDHRRGEPGGAGAGVRALGGRADRVAVAGPAAPRAARPRRWASAGLVLNSPWLDLHGPAILRTAADVGGDRRAVAGAQDARWCAAPARAATGLTLHRDYHGEFDYNLQLEAARRLPGDVRLDPRRSGAVRPRCTAGWTSACRT